MEFLAEARTWTKKSGHGEAWFRSEACYKTLLPKIVKFHHIWSEENWEVLKREWCDQDMSWVANSDMNWKLNWRKKRPAKGEH